MMKRQTLLAYGGEKGLTTGILSGRRVGLLLVAISTVSGMTSNIIGFAIREDLVTSTGMSAGSLGLDVFFSVARKSSSVKNISTSVSKETQSRLKDNNYTP